MVTITITRRHVIEFLAGLGFVFMMIMTMVGSLSGILGNVILDTVASGNTTEIHKMARSMDNTTSISKLDSTSQSIISGYVSIYNIYALMILPFFIILVLYFALFTKYDDSEARKIIIGLSQWLARRVKKDESAIEQPNGKKE